MPKLFRRAAICAACAIVLTGCAGEFTAVSEPSSFMEQTTAATSAPPAETAVTTAEQAVLTRTPVAYTPFEKTYEAESGILSGNAKTAEMENSSGEAVGYVTRLDDAGDGWALEITVDTAQYYSLTLRVCADKQAKNGVLADGAPVGELACAGKSGFLSYTFDNLYLTAATHTIALEIGDGGIGIDSLTLTASSTISDLSVGFDGGNIPTLSNKKADARTAQIYTYLCRRFGGSVLSGQFVTPGSNAEIAAVYNATGLYPAIRFSDMMPYTAEGMDADDVQNAVEWSRMGGLVGYVWHWAAPGDAKNAFYSKDTAFKLSDAVTDVNIARLDEDQLERLCAQGKISESCVALVKDIDKVSAELAILKEHNVTVLWRPLHEAGGGWFWWGEDKASYQWLWKLLYERQTAYFGLDNLIWIWNAQNADWYVGDNYCDIISADIYGDAANTGQINAFLAQTKISPNKPVALSECGDVPYAENMVRDKAMWSWFAVWSGDYIINPDGSLNEAVNTRAELVKLYSNNIVITLDELPEFTGDENETDQTLD
ncbi:MAG: glycosyl hydrolase [Oscillospiraceae bacterium]